MGPYSCCCSCCPCNSCCPHCCCCPCCSRRSHCCCCSSCCCCPHCCCCSRCCCCPCGCPHRHLQPVPLPGRGQELLLWLQQHQQCQTRVRKCSLWSHRVFL